MGEREDAFIPKLEAAIGTCDPEAVPLLEEMLKTYRRKNRRLERIIRQSDKQQMAMVKLNEELERTYGQLEEYKNRLEELREYDVYQQEIARKKVEAGIIAENSDGLAFQHLFVPSDILSGDFYSVYRKENGATFFFILDGQGHGISPSLTVFSVASIINRYVRTTGSLRELLDLVLPYVQQFLADGEQLSYSFLEICPRREKLDYAIGGMYPAMLKRYGQKMELEATGYPIMNFMAEVEVATADLDGWQGLVVYSDGIIEGREPWVEAYAPEKLLETPPLLERAREEIPRCTREDDVTVLAFAPVGGPMATLSGKNGSRR